MKAVTLHQPWASLVALGAKRIETRSWGPSHRGPLAIHAAKQVPANWSPFRSEAFVNALEHEVGLNAMGVPNIDRLPLGAVVATVDLVEVRRVLPWGELDGWFLSEAEREFGNYDTLGGPRFGWVLEDVRRLDPPVPAKGFQRLWDWRDWDAR